MLKTSSLAIGFAVVLAPSMWCSDSCSCLGPDTPVKLVEQAQLVVVGEVSSLRDSIRTGPFSPRLSGLFGRLREVSLDRSSWRLDRAPSVSWASKWDSATSSSPRLWMELGPPPGVREPLVSRQCKGGKGSLLLIHCIVRNRSGHLTAVGADG
jgi:hypothetical protein